MSRQRKKGKASGPGRPARPSGTLKNDDVGNVISRLGTASGRTAHNRVVPGTRLKLPELSELGRDGLGRTICWELPQDAATPVRVVTDALDPQAVTDAFDDLAVSRAFMKAGALARQYGGAAVYVDVDDGRALDAPIDMRRVLKVRRLHVFSRRDLYYQYPLEERLESPNFGRPIAYHVYPATGEVTVDDEPIPSAIHHSRLIRFYGEDVSDDDRIDYDHWGQPTLELVWTQLANLQIAETAGAELTHQVGQLALYLDNLPEMASAEGAPEMERYMANQMLAASTLNALLLGPKDRLERLGLQLTGWSDVFDRLVQMLAGVTRMPIVKLFGAPPSGLTSDDKASARQWSKRVDSYQDDILRPAYNYLLQILFASKLGPTKGEPVASWRIEFEPYEVPSEQERADTTTKRVTSLGALVSGSVISAAEARASLDGERGITLLAEEDGRARLTAEQCAVVLEISESVRTGRISHAGGVRLLCLAIGIDTQVAAELLGADVPLPPQAPAAGVPTW